MAQKSGSSKQTDAAGTAKQAASPKRRAAARKRKRIAAFARHAPLTVPRFLRKFSELALMAAFLAPIVAYHLSIPLNWSERLMGWIARLNGGEYPIQTGQWGAIFLKDFLPFLQQAVPVLEVKSAVWVIASLLLVGIHFCAKLYERLADRAVYPIELVSARKGIDYYRLVPFVCALAFLVWSLFSFSAFGWSPMPPPDAVAAVNPLAEIPAAAIEGEGAAAKITSAWADLTSALMKTKGGSFHSTIAWAQLAVALMFFLAAEDIFRTRRLVYKVLGLFLALGIIAAITALATHARIPGIDQIWVKWGPQEYRNDVGGFIGHNTAISSFLMAPFIISFTLLMAHRRRLSTWVGWFLVSGMVVMALVLILAQSRAVIPILFISFLSLLVLLSRRATLRPGLGFWVAVPLIILGLLATQLIDTRVNPFFRRSLPLAERIEHLSGEHLMTETRLRILAVSLPVVGENFLRGTGFGTFQYVYPQAQGEYFQEHPTSPLAPTDRRTFRAHNEYLQTIFETGMVGLGLGLLALVMILRGGWKTLQGSFRQRHIAIELAVLISAVAILVHALADFPFRVPPITVSLLTLLAIWSAGDRLWLIPVTPLDKRDPGETEKDQETDDDEFILRSSTDLLRPSGLIQRGDFDAWTKPPDNKYADEATGRKSAGRKGKLALWFSCVLLLTYGVILGGSAASHWFAGQQLNLRGIAELNAYSELPQDMRGSDQALGLLDNANFYLRNASNLLPLFGEPLHHRGRFSSNVAQAYAIRNAALVKDGEVGQAANARRATLEMGGRALFLTNSSMSEMLFHGSFRQRAGIYYLLYAHSPNRDSELLHRALEDLETSVLMNPGDPGTIAMLIQWKQRFQPDDTDQIRQLYHMLYHFHSKYFNTEILARVGRFMTMGEMEQAYELMAQLYEISPDNIELTRLYVNAAVYAGQFEEARRANLTLLSADDPYEPIFKAAIAIGERDYNRALNVIDQAALPEDEDTRITHRVMQLATRARVAELEGDEVDATAAWNELREMLAADPDRLSRIQSILFYLFNLPGRAEEFARQRINTPGANLWGGDFNLLASIELERYDEQLEAMQLQYEDAMDKGGKLPSITDEEMLEAVMEALSLYETAFEYIDQELEHEIVDNKMRRLERLLPTEQTVPETE